MPGDGAEFHRTIELLLVAGSIPECERRAEELDLAPKTTPIGHEATLEKLMDVYYAKKEIAKYSNNRRKPRPKEDTKVARTKAEDGRNGQPKIKARGACYDFQKGICKRGTTCKFSHDQEKGGVPDPARDHPKSEGWK